MKGHTDAAAGRAKGGDGSRAGKVRVMAQHDDAYPHGDADQGLDDGQGLSYSASANQWKAAPHNTEHLVGCTDQPVNDQTHPTA